MADNIIVRIRSRSGQERVHVPKEGTIESLRQAILQQLPSLGQQVVLSQDQGLLVRGNDPTLYLDLAEPSMTLRRAGIGHGSTVFMWTPQDRDLQSTLPKTTWETRPFGSKMTVEELISRQVRIERQKEANVSVVSVDRQCANLFQAYIHGQLAFSVKRGGICYGEVDEEGNVKVHVIYEPPQRGSESSLLLDRHHNEEQRADELAQLLGMQKVGWAFSQGRAERDYIISGDEVADMARMQADVGKHAVTCVVGLETSDDGQPHVLFEAFQCSEQCVRLQTDGWLSLEADQPKGNVKVVNPTHPDIEKPAIVERSDVSHVDTDWFLMPLRIVDHEGPFTCTFPIENRSFEGATPADLRRHMQAAKQAGRPDWQLLADFHLLLWLSAHLGRSEVEALVAAIKNKTPMLDGHRIILESLAAG